jgi:CheY-like chemotaxis protein
MTQRVLILEDQPFQRGFLANLFGSHAGVQVDACEDVDAAIALCACQPYDLVVSDLLMPGQDGIQFIQALAAQPRPPRLAVVSAAPRRMMTSARLMAESLGLDVVGLLPSRWRPPMWTPCSRPWRRRVRPPARPLRARRLRPNRMHRSCARPWPMAA